MSLSPWAQRPHVCAPMSGFESKRMISKGSECFSNLDSVDMTIASCDITIAATLLAMDMLFCMH